LLLYDRPNLGQKLAFVSFFESLSVAKTRPLCCSLNAFVQKLHTLLKAID